MRQKQESCKQRDISCQPQVFVIRESLKEAQQVLVLCQGVAHEVKDIIKAVDVCFKMFFGFNLQYPVQVEDVWLLLQVSIYMIATLYVAAPCNIILLTSVYQNKRVQESGYTV